MDSLSDSLDLVRLRGVVYFRERFAAPWGMDMPASPVAQFHYVARGRCMLMTVDRDTPIPLNAGDIAVLMRGEAHALGDTPTSHRIPGTDVLAAHRAGDSLLDGDGEPTVLVCGHFEFDQRYRHPMFEELPSLIHLSHPEPERRSWLDSIADAIMAETAAVGPGGDLVVNRLAEVLFVHVLRRHIAETDIGHGHLAALKDPRLIRALNELHASTDRALNLADLATAAGMSRSAFAERFRRVVGMTPMRYLTDWRMLRARALLEAGNVSIAEASARVGYASEAAFARAFKKQFGTPPGKVRRGLAA